LYSKSFAKSFKESICQDSSNSLPSGQTIFEQLSKQIAYEFTKDISPSYSYIEVEVIDDEDIDLTPMEEKMFENSLKLMERKNIKLANELLYKLTQETQNKSASIMYNLAVTYEYLEDLDSANKFYQLAKEITLKDEMDENILKESSRIQKALENKKKAMRQIER
jgi:tetratricopeptide (TPR) repeat protein